MSSSSLTLQSMLHQERQEEHLRLLNSLQHSIAQLPSQSQNSIWRPYLAEWYFSVLQSIEEFDGNNGTFPRSLAYSALKIMDLYLTSQYCTREFREVAKIDQCAYKCLAIGCLFVALNRRCTIRDIQTGGGGYDDGIILAGRTMPLRVFLRMCNSSPDSIIPFDAFILGIDSIRALLGQMYNEIDCVHPSFEPCVSTYFLDELKEYLCRKFPAIKDKDDLFYRVEMLMDCTLSNPRFADYSPSLNAMASFMLAMQEYFADDDYDSHGSEVKDMLTELITYYHRSGGYNDLSYLAMIVVELRSSMLERERAQEQDEQRRSQDDSYVIHVIPDY